MCHLLSDPDYYIKNRQITKRREYFLQCTAVCCQSCGNKCRHETRANKLPTLVSHDQWVDVGLTWSIIVCSPWVPGILSLIFWLSNVSNTENACVKILHFVLGRLNSPFWIWASWTLSFRFGLCEHRKLKAKWGYLKFEHGIHREEIQILAFSV